MTLPAPERDWVATFNRLGFINTTAGTAGKLTVEIPAVAPNWAREVLLNANLMVKGKGSAGKYIVGTGNLYFWTMVTRNDGSTGNASIQSRFGSVGGQGTSVNLTGWCPINQDHRTAYLEVDLDNDADTEILGGTFYMMGFRD